VHFNFGIATAASDRPAGAPVEFGCTAAFRSGKDELRITPVVRCLNHVLEQGSSDAASLGVRHHKQRPYLRKRRLKGSKAQYAIVTLPHPAAALANVCVVMRGTDACWV
jgi:hypothetical protein